MILSHFDFIETSFSIHEQSTGSFDLIPEISTVFSGAGPVTPNPLSYPNIVVTYQQNSSAHFLFDAQYQIDSQSFLSLTENLYSEVTPNLTWSSFGYSSISYSIGNYNGAQAPNWVKIDSSTGILKISAPAVSGPTDFSFYINTAITGVSTQLNKIIYLRVNKWIAKNCSKCKSDNNLFWAVCNYGYDLISGNWTNEDNTSTRSAIITSRVIVGISILIVVFSSLLSSSSLSSIWSIVNQLQLLFLLLLTNVYFPSSVIEVIVGSEFALSPFGLNSSNSFNFESIKNWLEFEQYSQVLYKIGWESGSTFINNYSFFVQLAIVISIHLIVILLVKIASKWSNKVWISKLIKWILQKIYQILTFGYYIRVILEWYQFILITCISEINKAQFSSLSRTFSFIIAIIVLICWLNLLLIILSLILSANGDQNERSNKFNEFFEGIKENKLQRLYVFLLLFRRVIFVSILISLTFLKSIFIVAGLSLLQLIYLIWVIMLRPYIECKDNVVEIINEFYFTALLLSLLHFDSLDKWSKVLTDAYIWIIQSNNVVILFVIMSNFDL